MTSSSSSSGRRVATSESKSSSLVAMAMAVFVVLCGISVGVVESFNVDLPSALTHRGPQSGSYFGFSVDLHKDRGLNWYTFFFFISLFIKFRFASSSSRRPSLPFLVLSLIDYNRTTTIANSNGLYCNNLHTRFGNKTIELDFDILIQTTDRERLLHIAGSFIFTSASRQQQQQWNNNNSTPLLVCCLLSAAVGGSCPPFRIRSLSLGDD